MVEKVLCPRQGLRRGSRHSWERVVHGGEVLSRARYFVLAADSLVHSNWLVAIHLAQRVEQRILCEDIVFSWAEWVGDDRGGRGR